MSPWQLNFFTVAHNTGLFGMIVRALTTCHTHNTLEIGAYVFFYLIEQPSRFLLHALQVLFENF